MKINRVQFLNALQKVTPGLAPKEVIEQTTCFIFTKNHIAAYNDEIAISYPFDIGFTGAIENKELVDLLTSLDKDEINVIIKDNEFRVIIKNDKSGLKIQSEITLPLDFLEQEIQFKKLPGDFNEALKTCMMSVDNDPSTVFGYVHVLDDFVESCNNYSFTRYTLPDAIKKELLIPASACRHLNKYKLTAYCKKDAWIHFKEKSTGLIFSCRTIDNTYPDCNDFLKVKGKKITMPEKLYSVLSRSKIFASDKKAPDVVITLADNTCTVHSQNEKGWRTQKIDMNVENEIEFGIDAAVLQTVLKNINRAIVGPSSIKFKAKNYAYVINTIDE